MARDIAEKDLRLGELKRRQSDVYFAVLRGDLPVVNVLAALERILKSDFGTPMTFIDQGPYRGYAVETVKTR